MDHQPPARVVIVSSDQALAAAAAAAVTEGGGQPYLANDLSAEQAGLGFGEAAPALVVVGADAPEGIAQRIAQLGSTQLVSAALGEGPASEFGQCLVLPRDTASLVRLVESLAAPRPASKRIMVMGAHGGVGASSLAAVLARQARSGGRTVRLVDFDGSGARLAQILGLASGGTWAEALGKWGVAWASLPSWHGVSVLAGLGSIGRSESAHRLRQVLDQWEQETGDGLTVIDSAVAGPGGPWRVATWCDHVVIVARDDSPGLAAAQAVVSEVAQVGLKPCLALRPVKGGAGPAGAKRAVGASRIEQVLVLGNERNLAADATHGLTPGDRPRGALSSWAGHYLQRQLALRAPPTKQITRSQRHRRHREPHFEPAAFAEDW